MGVRRPGGCDGGARPSRLFRCRTADPNTPSDPRFQLRITGGGAGVIGTRGGRKAGVQRQLHSVPRPNASGTGLGPPLVHKIYEPGHHQDFTIQSAVRNGVPAHHWQFGNMPPVPTVSDEDVPNIICYIRELQRANGIIAPDANLAAC